VKTRISTRPCPGRPTELLRQGGIHPVLARVYAARGLSDPRELASELQALLPPAALLQIDAAASYLADAIRRQEDDHRRRLRLRRRHRLRHALRGLRSMGARSITSCRTASNTATA
jgi:single-stranded-DNA-specific exonuclease